jgi:hypothetical protein
MTGWIVLGFGLLLVGVALRGLLGERRAAVRGRRQVREDLVASVALLLVLGGAGTLLGLAMLLVFPRD